MTQALLPRRLFFPETEARVIGCCQVSRGSELLGEVTALAIARALVRRAVDLLWTIQSSLTQFLRTTYFGASSACW